MCLCLQNPLVKRVLSIFDTNGDGRVSFIEFLVGLSKLAAGTDEMQKTKFAFDVYDINKDGHISNGELFAVMKMMVGNNLNDQQVGETGHCKLPRRRTCPSCVLHRLQQPFMLCQPFH